MRHLSAAAIGPLLVATLVLFAAACGSERPGERGSASTQPDPQAELAAAGVLPCTQEDEPTNFAAYSLGPEFEGLALNLQHHRLCTLAPPRFPAWARENTVAYTYGKCKLPEGEGGCSPPLSVLAGPRCERGFSPPSPHNPLEKKAEVRGVEARLYEDGYRLELLTGDSAVRIFGNDRAQVLRAGRALIRGPAKPSEAVKDGQPSGPLPSPPTGLPPSGPTPCR